jgi:hypothetical protein
MAARFSMALVALAAMSVTTGCTIIHEKPNAEAPAQSTADGQPAATTAGTEATGPKKTQFIPNFRGRIRGASENAPQPAATGNVGTLAVKVIDGSCQIGVDGQDFGMTNEISTQVAIGEHTVDCKPLEGTAQTHKATVKANDTTHVIISLQAGQAADGQVPESVQNQLKQ